MPKESSFFNKLNQVTLWPIILLPRVVDIATKYRNKEVNKGKRITRYLGFNIFPFNEKPMLFSPTI